MLMSAWWLCTTLSIRLLAVLRTVSLSMFLPIANVVQHIVDCAFCRIVDLAGDDEFLLQTVNDLVGVFDLPAELGVGLLLLDGGARLDLALISRYEYFPHTTLAQLLDLEFRIDIHTRIEQFQPELVVNGTRQAHPDRQLIDIDQFVILSNLFH